MAKNNDMEGCFVNLLSIITGFILVFYQAGIVLSIYNWYAPEAFSGYTMPEISYLTAFGISLFLSLFQTPNLPSSKEEAMEADPYWGLGKRIVSVIRFTLILGLAWVGTLFM